MATTIKLPDELKARIQKLSKASGRSAHAFMLEAIERETTRAEKRARFLADAREARDEMDRTGLGYDLGDVSEYLTARAAGKKSPRPKLKPWRK